MRRRLTGVLGVACLLVTLAPSVGLGTQEAPLEPAESQQPGNDVAEAVAVPLPEKITPADWWVLPRVGDYRRASLHIDPVEVAIARGDWTSPESGDEVRRAAGGAAVWRSGASDRGSDLVGGYAYAEFESPAAGVMLLDAAGCAAVCVNGTWLPGDPYGVGWFRLPVVVDQGSNWVLAHLARPSATPTLLRPDGDVEWLPASATLPDLVVADSDDVKSGPQWASIVLSNAGEEALEGAKLRIAWGDDKPVVRDLRRIESRLVTPISMRLPSPPKDLAVGDTPKLRVEILGSESADVLATCELAARAVAADEERVATHRSRVDGSVQPYAVRPATGSGEAGLIVLLHDAGQTAAECLAGVPAVADTHLIAPGGRGAWGFDWEDWSRLDALETLDDFSRRAKRAARPVDRDRVAVCGRGMGGHGALRLATLDPDRFAAAGITDGWISFYTQGGAQATPPGAAPLRRVLGRQASANDPLRVLANLRSLGVSVRHTGRGVASESRYLRELLGEFHPDLAYRESTGKGSADEAYAEQLRWLASRRRSDPGAADRIEFATPDVGVASANGWATILLASRSGEPAQVRLDRDTRQRQITGTTDNVRRLRIDLSDFLDEDEAEPVRLRLDGSRPISFRPGRQGESISLARDSEGEWRRTPGATAMTERFAPPFKTPARAGGLKSGFDHRPWLVYGTRGSEAARRWAADKARYDAHQFLYRGAGRLEVAPDTAYAKAFQAALAGGRRDIDRSIVLYGNEQTNSAWSLAWAPRRRIGALRVEAGVARVGPRPETGDDLAVLAIRPRPLSARSTIAIVGGTGAVGMRLTTRLRYFWSGVAYPDLLLFGPGALAPPPGEPAEADVRAAGYFGFDWDPQSDEVIWRDLAI